MRKFKKAFKLFIIWFPVILVTGQVVVNLLSFVAYDWYVNHAFWLNHSFGTNILYSIFLLGFTFMFRMCAVSRWAAVAECLFAINYGIVQVDSLYNIMFQIIVGSVALMATFWHYIKKFPHCNFSVGLRFIGDVIKKGSCKKGLDHFDMKKSTVRNHEG